MVWNRCFRDTSVKRSYHCHTLKLGLCLSSWGTPKIKWFVLRFRTKIYDNKHSIWHALHLFRGTAWDTEVNLKNRSCWIATHAWNSRQCSVTPWRFGSVSFCKLCLNSSTQSNCLMEYQVWTMDHRSCHFPGSLLYQRLCKKSTRYVSDDHMIHATPAFATPLQQSELACHTVKLGFHLCSWELLKTQGVTPKLSWPNSRLKSFSFAFVTSTLIHPTGLLRANTLRSSSHVLLVSCNLFSRSSRI